MRYLYRRSFRVFLIGLLLLVIFIFARPYSANWLSATPPPPATIPDGIVTIQQAGQVMIVQGKSDQAFEVINMMSVPVVFTLGYAHPHLALEPLSGTLAPGTSRDIIIHVDDLCPVGDINTMVYLKAETEDENLGMSTYDILLSVTPGELVLDIQDGYITATWNGQPDPEGVMLYYRDTEDEEERWRDLGQTPFLLPPDNLRPGYYLLEFIAIHGEIESGIVLIEVFVEEVVNSQTGTRSSSSGSTSSGSTRTPREEPEPPIHSQTGSRGMLHTVYHMEHEEAP